MGTRNRNTDIAGEQLERDDSSQLPEVDGEQLLELMLEQAPVAAAPPGVVIGKLVEVSPRVMVTYEEQPRGVEARATVALIDDDVGREVALLFERGDIGRPIITGLLQPGAAARPRHEVEIDDKTAVLDGKERIVLRCGKASITLTRAGKVLVKGTYVSSRSTGVHRIKGGSVQIN